MSALDDPRGPLDEHLGERASAYLDGELDAGEHAAAEAHMARCPACRVAVAAEGAVRDAVRALGPVEPPPGFLDHVLAAGPRPSGHAPVRRRRRLPIGLAQLAATAAVWVVILGFGINRDADGVAPDASGYVAAHAAAAATLSGGGATDRTATTATSTASTATTASTAAADKADKADTTDSALLPPQVGDFVRIDVRAGPEGVQALYQHGDELVSVFVQMGMLEPRNLGPGAEAVTVGGLPVYRLRGEGDADVLVFQRGAAVYVVVTPSVGDVDRVPADLPPTPAPPPSLGDRLRAAAESLTDCFGLAG